MEDWEQSKAEAAARTRLNQVEPQNRPPGVSGGGPGDLASSPAKKRGAANAIETRLEPDTARDGRHTEEAMNAAAKTFAARDGDGWQSSGGLKKALETWERQAKGLVHRLTTEKGQLRQVASGFTSADGGVADQFRKKSGIDGL